MCVTNYQFIRIKILKGKGVTTTRLLIKFALSRSFLWSCPRLLDTWNPNRENQEVFNRQFGDGQFYSSTTDVTSIFFQASSLSLNCTPSLRNLGVGEKKTALDDTFDIYGCQSVNDPTHLKTYKKAIYSLFCVLVNAQLTRTKRALILNSLSKTKVLDFFAH